MQSQRTIKPAPSLVTIAGLYKQYESDAGVVTPVLKDVNLTINEGEFVAIMGPSGSGKSTFMNILGCLDVQTKGSYHLSGVDVRSLSHNEVASLRNKVLGFVFQSFNLLPRRTALHNVAMPLICSGANKAVWLPRAQSMLTNVGLSERTQSMPNELSGGQQQRVAIARAMANYPRVILADEPTGNLDSATSEEILALFRELNAKEHITIILVTHEPDVAQSAKRLVKFHDGRIIYDGPVTTEGISR